jgi:hypothetical protein
LYHALKAFGQILKSIFIAPFGAPRCLALRRSSLNEWKPNQAVNYSK